MLRIEAGLLRSVEAATSAEDLHPLIEGAIALEFATIPPYLTAMLSLPPGQNRDVWQILHSIVIDEMLHMAIACNLLNALGGRPKLDRPDFVPAFPTKLPMAVNESVTVGLEPFSPDLVERVFMEIEEPEDPIVINELAAQGFATIGQFYAGLIAKIMEIGDPAFVGDPARQLTAPNWFPARRLFPLTKASEAVSALAELVQEGEGTKVTPLDKEGEVAHYYRFQQLVRGRRLVPDETADSKFSYSGDVIPFDPHRVHPLKANQRLTDLESDSKPGRRARHFALTFTKLLQALDASVNGHPERFDAAMGLMFELKVAGQILCGLQVGTDPAGNPVHAGPTFEYLLA